MHDSYLAISCCFLDSKFFLGRYPFLLSYNPQELQTEFNFPILESKDLLQFPVLSTPQLKHLFVFVVPVIFNFGDSKHLVSWVFDETERVGVVKMNEEKPCMLFREGDFWSFVFVVEKNESRL